MIGNPEKVPVIQITKELYKGPSELCNCGTTGYKNNGSLSTMPYSNSKKLLEGLLALKMPVTLIYIIVLKMIASTKVSNYKEGKKFKNLFINLIWPIQHLFPNCKLFFICTSNLSETKFLLFSAE